jgi:hypothetical protein
MVCESSCIPQGSCLGISNHLCIYIFGGFSMVYMQPCGHAAYKYMMPITILTWSTWTHRSSWVPTQPGSPMSGSQMHTLRRTICIVQICCLLHHLIG